ncbi:hypothetical protein CS006_03545 [Bifidobacterium primatium]|uniref:Virulence factor protein n=2 Tax=Bifidobacterium primatium TaxID=2045438 RepID=A0A2M9HBN2_9BIFI|nr:hypothetical protein CS006_03545 [Bifidobacterium primatium]
MAPVPSCKGPRRMSNSVGRNSLIMAAGTAASRVTGQIRSILLAAAIGTTGIAANAYQTGSMIPQVIFTLISGGIFNAVLVPQIVRTLKHKDANERLSKLITLAIALLLGITALMMLATPIVTRLYVNPNWAPEQRALVDAFTLWCMPQIFFYGLYLVLGQILAAKGRFGTYAWSSVGANVISCAGFIAFIMMFGNASRQPMEFWTNDKILLTAGTWTLGVAFQALVLFVPLLHIGLKYRIKWGIHGIGLRSMGKVAIWSLALTVLNLIVGMVTSQINTGAPLAGHDLHGIAGNGSYQYAYSLYILPYSLIAVSITTAVFPKLSRAISDNDIASARADLSSSVRNVGLSMMFFSAALIAMPVPITRALLPSVSVHDALLIAGPLVSLSVGLVPISAFLLIQRTFYAYEDGKSPFLFALFNNAVQLVFLLVSIAVLPPQHWAMLVGLSLSIAYLVTIPFLFLRLRRRMGGSLDGRRILVMHAKALVAGAVSGVASWLVGKPLMALLGVHYDRFDGVMRWVDSLIICVVLTIVIAAVYAALLMVLRVSEFTDLIHAVAARLGRGRSAAQPDAVGNADTGESNHDGTDSGTPDDAAAAARNTVKPRTVSSSTTGGPASVTDSSLVAQEARPSGTPTYRIATAESARNLFAYEKSSTMKPGLGDTLIDRYTLVQVLREEPGLSVWRANDSVMAKDCQLFLISDVEISANANEIASSLVLSHNPRFTPIQQIRSEEGACIIITDLDPGISLSRYLAHNAGAPHHALSAEAIRTIMGESVEAALSLRAAKLNHRAISADVIRLTSQHVTLADAPISSALVPALLGPSENPDSEAVVIRQLAAVLFEAVTGHRYEAGTKVDSAEFADVPEEFRIICMRGLGLHEAGEPVPVPISTLNEFEVLLGTWKPVTELTHDDMTIASHASSQSVELVQVLPAKKENIVDLPAAFRPAPEKPQLSQEPAGKAWSTNQLLFSGHREVDEANPEDFASDYYDPLSPDLPLQDGNTQSKPTLGLDVSSIRHGHAPSVSDTADNLPAHAAASATGPAVPMPVSVKPALPENPNARNANAAQGAKSNEGVGDATIVMEPLPASFEPQLPMNPPSYSPTGNVQQQAAMAIDEEEQSPEVRKKQRMHRIVAVLCTVVVLAVIFAGAAMALGLFSPDKGKTKSADAWPSINTSEVGGFPSSSSTAPSTSSTPKKTTASATPTPSNTTAYTTSTQTFVDGSATLGGRGWYVQLAQQEDVSRVVVSLRQPGGKAAIYAGATSDNPTGGTKVAEFSFAAGGTTEVKLSKSVKTQSLVIWVPSDTTPEGGLYFNSVQVY